MFGVNALTVNAIHELQAHDATRMLRSSISCDRRLESSYRRSALGEDVDDIHARAGENSTQQRLDRSGGDLRITIDQMRVTGRARLEDMAFNESDRPRCDRWSRLV